MARVEGNRLVEITERRGALGAVEERLFGSGVAVVDVGFDELRVKCDGFVKISNGFIPIALLQKSPAAVVVSFFEIAVEGDGYREVVNGSDVIFLFGSFIAALEITARRILCRNGQSRA